MDKKEKELKKIKQRLQKSLKKIKVKKQQIDDIIDEIEGIAENIDGDLGTDYGTSCVQLRKKNGNLLLEY